MVFLWKSFLHMGGISSTKKNCLHVVWSWLGALCPTSQSCKKTRYGRDPGWRGAIPSISPFCCLFSVLILENRPFCCQSLVFRVWGGELCYPGSPDSNFLKLCYHLELSLESLVMGAGWPGRRYTDSQTGEGRREGGRRLCQGLLFSYLLACYDKSFPGDWQASNAWGLRTAGAYSTFGLALSNNTLYQCMLLVLENSRLWGSIQHSVSSWHKASQLTLTKDPFLTTEPQLAFACLLLVRLP